MSHFLQQIDMKFWEVDIHTTSFKGFAVVCEAGPQSSQENLTLDTQVCESQVILHSFGTSDDFLSETFCASKICNHSFGFSAQSHEVIMETTEALGQCMTLSRVNTQFSEVAPL